jgi:hypothetical protein
MKMNMGKTDRVIRIIVAAILATLYIKNIAVGLIGFILIILAMVLVITSVFGICPLYAIFGIHTDTKKNKT